MLRRLELSHPGLSQELLATRLVHLTTEVAPGQHVWKYDPMLTAPAAQSFRIATFTGFAAHVSAPVLFVDGGPNGYHVAGEEQRLLAFRTLTRLELPGAGHMVHWTRPTELAHAILEHAAR